MDVPTSHAAVSLPPPAPSRDAPALPLSLVRDDEPAEESTLSCGGAVSDRPAATPGDAEAMLCRQWFERAVQGDVAAFESLYRYLHGPLRRFTETYVRSAHVAEEIVQDVFLAVWEERASLRLTRNVKGYFYVAVRNRALNYVKRRQAEGRASDRLAREEGMREVRNAAEERIARDELAVAVRHLIEQLPPRTRQAYTLYYQHELSYAEIAVVMGTAVKTVENQLARALRHIHRRIAEITR